MTRGHEAGALDFPAEHANRQIPPRMWPGWATRSHTCTGCVVAG